MKKVKTIELKSYAVMKEKLLLLLLRQFNNNREKPRKNSNPLIDNAEKKIFLLTKLKALSIINLKAERRVRTFYQEKLCFQHMWNKRNDLAIRQEFRADFV